MAQNFIKWISVSERITQCRIIVPEWPALLGSLDATVQPINRPKVDQKNYYSGKHKMHCIETQALASPNGFLIHFTLSIPGSNHDFALFNNSNLKILIENENKCCQALFQDNCTVFVDAGYQRLSNQVQGAAIPIKII